VEKQFEENIITKDSKSQNLLQKKISSKPYILFLKLEFCFE